MRELEAIGCGPFTVWKQRETEAGIQLISLFYSLWDASLWDDGPTAG